METKRRRKQELKERKNYLPTIMVILALWLIVAGFILFTNPQTQGAIPVFFLLVFAALTFTFSILLANTRRGILVSLVIVAILGLRIVGMANPLNIVLLVSAFAVFELYFSRNF